MTTTQRRGVAVVTEVTYLGQVHGTLDWCEARLPNHPQPVAPTDSPEVAARHIVDAVFDGRRPKMLGAWNKLIFTGIKTAPAVLAHFAARTSVSAAQPVPPTGPATCGTRSTPNRTMAPPARSPTSREGSSTPGS